MKASFHLSIIRAATIALSAVVLNSAGLAQVGTLEDRPYQPSASVVKGTIAALSDSSEEVVALAVRALGDWRQADAAPDIIKLLGPDSPAAVRIEALNYFSRIGAKAKPHIAEVLKYLTDPDPNIRSAALAVVLAADASADQMGAIRPLLDDPRSDTRAAAANCLGQAGKAAATHRPALLKAIADSGSAEFKAAALRSVARIGGLTDADVEALTPLLSDRDPETRIAAWAVILTATAEAKAAGTLSDEKFATRRTNLVKLLEKEPTEIKASIIENAGASKTSAEVYIAGLVKQIQSGAPEVKAAALRVIGKAGDAALPHAPLIVEQAKSPDSTVRAAAISALGALGPAAVKPNFELVANALRDPSDLARSEALQALPAAGDALRNFPYKIRDVFPTADASIRSTLVKAVPIIVRAKGIDEDSLSQGRAALADPDPDVRVAMAFVIAQSGAATGTSFQNEVLNLTKDTTPAVRGAAALTLRVYAVDAAAKEKLRAALLPMLKDHDAEVRWAALDTLHELDPGKDPAAVTAIAALLKDEDQPVRSAAARALGAAGPAAKAHLLDIIRLFNDDPAIPPYAAAQAVAELSPLTPQELVSLLSPLYVYSDLLPLTRLTAYGASGGDRDGQMIIRLLGRSRSPAREVVAAGDTDRAITMLQDALKAPSLHPKLKAEIDARVAELKAPR